MEEHAGTELTREILIALRDEMQALRSSVESRFDMIDSRLEGLDTYARGIAGKMGAFQARMEALESLIDSMDQKSDVKHRELFRRLESIDGDLKKFAGIVNETVLHYAEEMDSVRDRLHAVEQNVGVLSAPD